MKFLITTKYGMQEFSHFEYIYDDRMGIYNLNFYNGLHKIFTLGFEIKANLENAIKSLYYTIAAAAPGALLIDFTKVLNVKSEKEYLGYGINL
jgi:hypothetical protein